MIQHKDIFDKKLEVKSAPNTHERELFQRAKHYIGKLAWIPGIEMVAVVNSLSMYATHPDSDIDLFIVTKPRALWLVRSIVTGIFFLFGVWRRGDDIRGNFCLSFFVTTDALDLRKIAIKEDIYLYFWIYYMKPILVRDDIYDRFLAQNAWVPLSEDQKIQNLSYITFSLTKERFPFFWKWIDAGIRFLGEWKTRSAYITAGKPLGIVITGDMLKFHKEDRRMNIRDSIVGNQ